MLDHFAGKVEHMDRPHLMHIFRRSVQIVWQSGNMGKNPQMKPNYLLAVFSFLSHKHDWNWDPTINTWLHTYHAFKSLFLRYFTALNVRIAFGHSVLLSQLTWLTRLNLLVAAWLGLIETNLKALLVSSSEGYGKQNRWQSEYRYSAPIVLNGPRKQVWSSIRQRRI